MRTTVVFIQPPSTLKERYGWLAFAGGVEPPLGLCFLASMARKEGFRTFIIDAQALGTDINKTVDLAVQYNPDYIGITSTTSTILSVKKLAELIKNRNPNIKVILGGHHISALTRETMDECPYLDVGVIGEGEQTLPELLKAMENGSDLKSVKGIIAREGNELFVTERRSHIDNIDNIPFPSFDLLPDIEKSYRIPLQSLRSIPSFSLITSRGCRGQCTFCDRSVFGNKVRVNSAEYVMEMLRYVYKKGIKCVLFEDDDFLISKNRLSKLCELIIKEGMEISWSCCARIDMLDNASLGLAKEAGCWQVMVGIESGEQSILDFNKKRLNLEMLEGKLSLARKLGIEIKGFMIFGHPTETLESLRRTFDFILKIPLSDISTTFFTPFPGTEIWDHIGDYGTFDSRFDKLNCFEPVFIPYGLSRQLLVEYQKITLRRFYFRPTIICNYLKRIASLRMLREFISGFLVLVRRLLMLKNKDPETRVQEKTIIVNADDFGLSEGINKGIIKAYQEGIVRSASLVACGKHFKEAVELAKENKELDVGVHLCLTEEVPLSPHQEIPSIVGRSGRFSNTIRRFMLKYILGKVKMGEIEKEFSAQIARLFEFGIEPSHIDSHCHLHMFFGIADVVIKLAKVYNIRIIRLPFVPVKFMLRDIIKVTPVRIFYQAVLNLLCLSQRDKFINEGIRVVDSCFGLLDSGHMHKDKLLYIIKNIHPGISEILCHPGIQDAETLTKYGHWGYEWEKELESLIFSDTAALSRGYGIGLASFREIG